MARAGISVGDINQATASFMQTPAAAPTKKAAAKKPAPAPAPAASNAVTLKPLVNNKGKVVGYGHFKGDESQDLSAIPKKAPSTPAAKAQLKEAIAATTTPIAPSAQKKQAAVLQTSENKKMKAYNQAIAMGADPNSAANIAQAKNPQQAMKAFQEVLPSVQEQNASTLLAREAQENMMRRQNQLMAEIAKGPPLAPRSSRRLKGGYTPKFRSAGSVAERGRNVARGTYQFSNPLGMGGGASRTGGVGGLA